jgi:hypothetical protein
MKTAAYLLSGVVGFLGLIFLIASAQANTLPRLIIGLVLIATAVVIGAIVRAKLPEQRIIQQIDLTGDITPEKLTCNACGAPLSKDSVTVKAGAIVVSCPYCGTSYQLEEAPKW